MIFYRILHLVITVPLLFFSIDSQSHGFAENTLIITGKNYSHASIQQLAFAIKILENWYLTSV